MKRKRQARIFDRLKKIYPKAHWVRIESWTEPGIFDVNGCLGSVEIWVELKEVTNPKTARGKVRAKVEPEQIGWELQRRLSGGRTYVAFTINNDLVILKGIEIRGLSQGLSLDEVALKKIAIDGLFTNQ